MEYLSNIYRDNHYAFMEDDCNTDQYVSNIMNYINNIRWPSNTVYAIDTNTYHFTNVTGGATMMVAKLTNHYDEVWYDADRINIRLNA